MPNAYLIDMDGVLVSGNQSIPGAVEFIARLHVHRLPFLILTNNSRFTQGDLCSRLRDIGFNVKPESIFTSALATGYFLKQQQANGSAYVIGESGLIMALQAVGYTVTEHNPDFVVLGETLSYSFEQFTIAVRLIRAGVPFIATNPDILGPLPDGVHPACGAVAAMITAATGVKAYFVGKPNALMMRLALKQLGVHSQDTVMIGDRMDTDVVAGTESGMQTILVLSGVTRREDVRRFAYKPGHIVESVAHIQPSAKGSS